MILKASLRAGAKIVRVADLGATFVFAAEGAIAGAAAGLDPIGLLVLAFLTGLGGGIARDLLIADGRPAAVQDWHYSVIVLTAASAALLLHPSIEIGTIPVVIALDAAGLALAVIAGTEKALDHGIHPLVAIFLGTVGGVGGGLLRDLMLNEVPRVLRADIYAVAALLGAAIVVAGRARHANPKLVAVAGGLACFILRMAAVHYHWNLPAEPVHR